MNLYAYKCCMCYHVQLSEDYYGPQDASREFRCEQCSSNVYYKIGEIALVQDGEE